MLPTILAMFDNSAFIPERWAMESLAVLSENMVLANAVNRDYSNELAAFGQVVNTRRPVEFTAKTKTKDDDIDPDVTSADNVQVKLDQHIYESFIIKDADLSLSFQELVPIYLVPAAKAVARRIDKILCGQSYRFSQVGGIGKLDANSAVDYVVDADTKLNIQLCPQDNRNLFVTPRAKAAIIKQELFVAADKRGDGGNALETAQLGTILGFNTYMCQNLSSISSSDTDATTLALAAAKGATVLTLASDTNVVVGQFVTVDDESQVHYIADANADANTITLDSGLDVLCANGDAVTLYQEGAVKTTANQYYSKSIELKSANPYPMVGQRIAFGTSTRHTYTAVGVTVDGATVYVDLDHPLEYTITANDNVWLGPAGEYSMALRPDAIALVTRPLAVPGADLGVRSAVAEYNQLAMRITMQYMGLKQGILVTVDVLAGVALLDANQGVVLLG